MARFNPQMSVLGPGTRVTGRVTGNGGLSIQGTLKGDLIITGPAEISVGASLNGDVEAQTLDIAGSLIGDAAIQGPIAVREGALVRGDLRGTEVTIDPGARVSVHLDTPFELDLGRLGQAR
jgi:cytoskeletal protein CcmA (bactofilin family)